MMCTACIMYRLSLQGRLDYANSIMDDIIDSADRPLEVWYKCSYVKFVVISCSYYVLSPQSSILNYSRCILT